MKTEHSLKPPVVLVTGAGVRIGAAIAESLHAAGMAVILHANRSIAAAESLAGKLHTPERPAISVQADLTDPQEADALLIKAAAALRFPDYLVCNAGMFVHDTAADAGGEVWHAHMALHAITPARLTQAVAARSPGGAAVWIVDQRVLRPTPRFFSYTASKSLSASLVVTLAQGLAPHFRVNAVAPGPTLPSPRQNAADFAAQCLALPLQRGGSPEAIAEATLFLLSSDRITGTILPVDGGQHLAWETPDALLPE